jgi:hypothetical protein
MSYPIRDWGAHRENPDPPHLTFLALRALQQILSSELPVALAIILWWCCHRSRNTEKFSAAGQVLRTVSVAEETIVANSLEALWEYMQQKPPQKLVGRQGHQLLPVLIFVVLVGERDLSVLQLLEPVVGDGHPMGVAAQII